MAYNESTGLVTIDYENETFDEILDNVASALGDYRVTTDGGVAARDVGLLCTSPNINPASPRRPIALDGALELETEVTLAGNHYGYSTLKDYCKTSTGSGTTATWVNKLWGKTGQNLYGATTPTSTDYKILNYFDHYNHRALFPGQKATLNKLKTETLIASGKSGLLYETCGNGETVSVDYVWDDDYNFPVGYTVYENLKLRFTQKEFTDDCDEVVWAISGRYEASTTTDFKTVNYITTIFFDIDKTLTDAASTQTWTDSYGNTIIAGSDNGYPYVEVIISTSYNTISYTAGTEVTECLVGSVIISNDSTYQVDGTGKDNAFDTYAEAISLGIYNVEEDNTSTDKLGFAFRDAYVATGWHDEHDSYTPSDFLFGQVVACGISPILIVRLTYNGSTYIRVVNPSVSASVGTTNIIAKLCMYSDLFSSSISNFDSSKVTKVEIIYGLCTPWVNKEVEYGSLSDLDSYQCGIVATPVYQIE